LEAEPMAPDSSADDFDEELQRLTAASRELLESLRGPQEAGSAPVAPAPDAASAEEVSQLRRENQELRTHIEELEKLFQEHAPAPAGDQPWAERQREYEALLEEKSEVIRTLHLRIRELQERPAAAAPAAAAIRAEDLPDAEELMRVKEEIEDQRRQLQEDEEAMVTQLREMEMALSRDRAELARQRQEVQRLQTELAREIEMAGRDPTLRDRLNTLRRSDKPAGGSKPETKPAPSAPAEEKKQSGIFKRFFG
jgi:DNA repair exonuclease SbcCD ATPase subunit